MYFGGLAALMLFFGFYSPQLLSAEVEKQYAVELDPLMPVAASLGNNTKDGSKAVMWGLNAEFNLRGTISTGPEVWYGKFDRRGRKSAQDDSLDSELYSDERIDMEAIRIRWLVGYYEHPLTLSGWYLKSGISYTKIQTSAALRNRRNFSLADGTIPSRVDSTILDVRQGVVLGIGERWLVWESKASLSLGISYTAELTRNVAIDSEDSRTRKDYDALLESFPGSRLSANPYPEANVAFGYVF